MDSLSFTHRFEPALTQGRPPLLLLHGTGADENDLIPLGRMISPGSTLLSPRGKILENGMPRFFRRLAEGIFDEADVRFRANELADFVMEARAAYKLEAPIAVGFSNGANIAAAMMMLRPEAVAGAVLIRAMVPFSEAPEKDLSALKILILSGSQDPIIPASNAGQLIRMLQHRGAGVEHLTLQAGHGLTQQDVVLAQEWFSRVEHPA